MKSVLIIKGTQKSKAALKAALEKYKALYSKEIIIDEATSVSMGLTSYQSRKQELIFIDEPLTAEDVNVMQGVFPGGKSIPYVVTSDENVTMLAPYKDVLELVVAPYGLTQGFLLDYIRSITVEKKPRIDPRVLESMLRGVIEVLDSGFDIQVKPLPVKPRSGDTDINELTSVFAFSGDGLQASIAISLPFGMLEHLASSQLSLQPEDVDSSIIVDMGLEVSSQIVGVAVRYLRDVGYDLDISFRLVVARKGHSCTSRLTGKLFQMLFSFRDMELSVLFSYGSYLDFLAVQYLDADISRSGKLFDVRLANEAISAITQIFSANTNSKCRHLGADVVYRLGLSEDVLLNISHINGPSLHTTFLMVMKEENAKKIAASLLYMPEEEVTREMVTDSTGELLNQMVAKFRNAPDVRGYGLRPVFHADFFAEGPMTRLINSKENFLELKFATDDFEFSVMVGVTCSATPIEMDIFKWLKSKKVLPSQESA